MTNLILDFKSTLGHPAYGTIVDIMENQVQGMNVVGSLFHRLHPSLLGLVSGSSLLDALFFSFSHCLFAQRKGNIGPWVPR